MPCACWLNPGIPEQGIPDKLLDEGRAVIVIPDTIKAGLVIGGRRGHGLMSVRMPNGAWSNPVFVKLTGGSIGFQAGVQSSDVVLVFRNDRSLDNLVNGKFTLGADAGVAAGPVGRNAAAATDGQLKAEIWSWSRARGLFAGVALDGAVLQIDDAANLDAYGSNTTPRMIFEGRAAGSPSMDVVAFRDRLEEATYAARNNRSGNGGSAPRPAAAPAAAPVVLGPERLPKAARFAGLWVRRARNQWDSVNRNWSANCRPRTSSGRCRMCARACRTPRTSCAPAVKRSVAKPSRRSSRAMTWCSTSVHRRPRICRRT